MNIQVAILSKIFCNILIYYDFNKKNKLKNIHGSLDINYKNENISINNLEIFINKKNAIVILDLLSFKMPFSAILS